LIVLIEEDEDEDVDEKEMGKRGKCVKKRVGFTHNQVDFLRDPNISTSCTFDEFKSLNV